jgi:hypothetical protein
VAKCTPAEELDEIHHCVCCNKSLGVYLLFKLLRRLLSDIHSSKRFLRVAIIVKKRMKNINNILYLAVEGHLLHLLIVHRCFKSAVQQK